MPLSLPNGGAVFSPGLAINCPVPTTKVDGRCCSLPASPSAMLFGSGGGAAAACGATGCAGALGATVGLAHAERNTAKLKIAACGSNCIGFVISDDIGNSIRLNARRRAESLGRPLRCRKRWRSDDEPRSGDTDPG